MTIWKRGAFAGRRPRKPVAETRDYRQAEQTFLRGLFPHSLSAATVLTTRMKAVSDAPTLSPESADRALREFSEKLEALRVDFERHVAKKTVKP